MNNYNLILLLILVCLYLLLINKTNQTNRSINLAMAVVCGCLYFNASLFLCGRTFYDGNSFWTGHSNIKFITSLFLFSALGILMSQIRLKFYPLIMIIISVWFATKTLLFWKITYQDTISKRNMMYQIEKTNLFYSTNKSKISYLPHNNIIENWTYEDGFYDKHFYLIYRKQPPKKIIFLQPHQYKAQIQKDGLHIPTQHKKYQTFTDLYKLED